MDSAFHVMLSCACCVFFCLRPSHCTDSCIKNDNNQQTVKVPGRDNGIIPVEKIRDYLLSSNHPIGKFKAKFFHGLGYSRENWEALAMDIKSILEQGDVTKIDNTDYGKKYIVEGQLKSPTGSTRNVVTVWFVKNGGKAPRLVTVYPRR